LIRDEQIRAQRAADSAQRNALRDLHASFAWLSNDGASLRCAASGVTTCLRTRR